MCVSISEKLKTMVRMASDKNLFLYSSVDTYVRTQSRNRYVNLRRNHYLLKDLLALSLCSNSEYVQQQLLLKIIKLTA